MQQNAALRFNRETFANFLILRAQGSSPDEASAMCGLKLGGPMPLPSSMPAVLRANFARYTFVPAPNGLPIHIVAQAGVSTTRIMHERLKLTLLACRPVRDADSDPNALSSAGATLLLFEPSQAALYNRHSRWIRLNDAVRRAA